MTQLQNYNGFKYRPWAEQISDGKFQPKLAISKHYEIRHETLEKHFSFDETYTTEDEACKQASIAAPTIIDGLHPHMNVSDICAP